MIRSGRMRSALRTRSRMVTSPRAFDVRRPGLQPDHVLLLQRQLGGVLDRDDALGRWDERRERVEQRGLAGAGAAGDDDVQPGPDAGGEQLGDRPVQGAAGEQLGQPVRLGNSRIVTTGPSSDSGGRTTLTRAPRDPGVGRQPGVDHRAGLVDPAVDRGDDPVDGLQQLVLGGEPGRDPLQPAEPLDVDRLVPLIMISEIVVSASSGSSTPSPTDSSTTRRIRSTRLRLDKISPRGRSGAPAPAPAGPAARGAAGRAPGGRPPRAAAA